MRASSVVPFTSFVLSFAYFVLFNLFDLSSTILALRLGLSEGNFVLLRLSSSLGVGLSEAIVLVKSVFFVGVGGLLILGVASRNQTLKKTILAAIIFFGVVFALVSLSNFVTIYSVISQSQ